MTKWSRIPLLAVSLASIGSAASLQPSDLEVRLQNHLTSYSSPVGTAFRCVVIHQFETGGHVVIPKGSEVYGSVVKARRVGLGIVHERAGLELSFNEYSTPDGRRYPLQARLRSIDNAREQVTAKGEVKGVLAASNPSNLLNGFWMKPTSNLLFRGVLGLTGVSNQVWVKFSGGPISAAGIFAARCLLFPFPEPEIHLPPGTDMKLRVLVEPAGSEAVPDAQRAGAQAEFSDWLGRKLSRLTYRKGQTAPDLMNVVLVGTRPEIAAAFVTSGWYMADRRTLLSSSHMWQAFSIKTEYAAAPVSQLLYHGAPPDLVFEKSFDTITQRHHIRLWRAGVFAGQEVWLGAATHDTGIGFKLSSLAFSHKIDRNIDLEREKVSTDLTFAGCAGAPELLDGETFSTIYQDGRPHPELLPVNHIEARAQPATHAETKQASAEINEDGKTPATAAQEPAVLTDGDLVVLRAQACVANEPSVAEPKLPGTKLTRLTRRIVLEARNYVLRDNTYYWGYRMIRNRSLTKSIPE